MICGRGFSLGSKFGAKKVKFQFRPKRVEFQCAKRFQDRISELPDDILHGILSALPLKEAGRTSVLSPRWRNLWRHTSSLNFDAHEIMQKVTEQDPDSDLCLAARHEYVNWVNSVLRSHQGLTLNEFRICFHLERSSNKEVSDWVKFALNRKVQRLELNLLFGDDGDYDQDPDEKIVFPQELRNSHFTLRSLCLRDVLVSGEDIACLLRNCPLLEHLIVSCSDVLTSLKVCGSSLALKRLEIWCCRNLTSLKVSAPNLTSLALYKIEGLVLEDVPKLVNVYVVCMVMLPTISCCFSQLEMLTLKVSCSRKDLTPMFNFPEMLKLKKLVIMYFTPRENRNRGLLGLVSSFFKSSPFLQEFVFKQSWSLDAPERTNRQIDHKGKMYSHQHLNVVKFLGYNGCASDVELVNFFLKNCVALREIFVDPRDMYALFHSLSYYVPNYPQKELENEQTSRNYAKQQLELLVPNHIGLVIC